MARKPTAANRSSPKTGLRTALLTAALAILPVLPAPALAEDVYTINPPYTQADPRKVQAISLLRAALDTNKRKYGPYRIEMALAPMERERLLAEMKTGTLINVTTLLTDAVLEQELTPIRIPLDKGLSGFRVSLIDGQRQAEFSRVTTLEQLRAYTMGAGAQWISRSILEKDGFTVVAASSYEGMFGMLMKRRFDQFPRGIDEALAEQAGMSGQYPDLALEKTFAVHYPIARYFFVSPAAPRLAKRLREGMETLVANGEFDRMFFEYYGPLLEKARLCQRRIFKVDNPLLPAETPLQNAKLWFDPLHAVHGVSPCALSTSAPSPSSSAKGGGH